MAEALYGEACNSVMPSAAPGIYYYSPGGVSSQTLTPLMGVCVGAREHKPPPGPQIRTNSLDQLNFQERRQLIASTLSLSEFLGGGNKQVTNRLKDEGVGDMVGGSIPSTPTSPTLYPPTTYPPTSFPPTTFPQTAHHSIVSKTTSLSLSELLSTSKSKTKIKVKKGKNKTNGAIRGVNGSGGAPAGVRTPPERSKNASKFSAFGRLFKPWKWKRKKKSEKFEATSKTLERKISMRVNKEELVQKGILLPDSPTSPIAEEPSKEKSDGVNGSVVDGSSAYSSSIYTTTTTTTSTTTCSHPQPPDYHSHHHIIGAERPSSLMAGGPEGGVQVLPMEIPPSLHPVHQRDTYTFHGGTTASEGGRIHTYGHQNHSKYGHLPEPPIPVSEIGPIPPPPMFSSPSPMVNARSCPPPPYHPPNKGANASHQPPSGHNHPMQDYEDEELEDEDIHSDMDDGGFYSSPYVDTSRVEEVPAREPKLDAKPLKSALKKRCQTNGTAGTPTQDGGKSIGDRNSTKPLKFLGSDKSNSENKENSVPFSYLPPNTVLPGQIHPDDDSDDDGPTLYRDEEGDGSRLAMKIARKDSLAQKLALRPNRQDLIDRNIIPQASDLERREFRDNIGEKLTRRLSLRPSAEELEERNILRKTTNEEARREKEEKRNTLLRKLSFRPTVEELKERKIIRFNDYIEVTQAHAYDRRADKPWTRLTPRDKAAIRKELNDFKSTEMEVHEDSRHLTRFHRP